MSAHPPVTRPPPPGERRPSRGLYPGSRPSPTPAPAASLSGTLLPKRLPNASIPSPASSGRLGHQGRLPGLISRLQPGDIPQPLTRGVRPCSAQGPSRAPRFLQDEVQTLQQGSQARPDPALAPSGTPPLLLPASSRRGDLQFLELAVTSGVSRCPVPCPPATFCAPLRLHLAPGGFPTAAGRVRCCQAERI